MSRTLKLRIRRRHGWQDFTVQVAEDAYVLDALEAARQQDASLLFRHACHHASCGSCGMRINGKERLACITQVDEMHSPPRQVRLEPLRNFPLVGDLVVDYGDFMRGLQSLELPLIRQAEGEEPAEERAYRFENCIECGLCVSACPIAGSDPLYAGPAALAAAWRILEEPRQRPQAAAIQAVDHEHGVWRCHVAFECSEVCPANVDPARAIFNLRGWLLRRQSAEIEA